MRFHRIHTPLLILCVLLAATNVFSADETLLLRVPAISPDHIAFVHAGDIWLADRDGASPRRLTVHPGEEMFPLFSPDGKWIAFTGNYDGNTDVYIISIDGGNPIRLTYHPFPDVVEGWTPDGSAVLFSSPRDNYTYRFKRLHTVSIKGGFPEAEVLPFAEHGSYSSDGKYLAFTEGRDPYHTWKHYRGGRNSQVLVFDRKTKESYRIPSDGSNDSYPTWLNGKIYFLSDRNWTMNIFSFDPSTPQKAPVQITNHDDYDVKYVSAGDGILIYEQAGKLHTVNPATGEEAAIAVYINPDLPEIRPHFEKATNYISSYNVSPNGKRAVFSARGDIFTVPAEKGDIRNLTNSPGVHDRYPVWSPDGTKIAWVADKDGEYKLYVVDQKGLEEPEEYSLGGPSFYYLPQWSPDGEKILYFDKWTDLYYLDLDSKKRTKIDSNRIYGRPAMPRWSPDSKWVAYLKEEPTNFSSVMLYSLDQNKSIALTDGLSDSRHPAWSRDGKYLYFTASTNLALQSSFLDMSSYERPVERNIYMTLLAKETENPLLPESDDEDEPEEENKKDDDNGKKGKKKDENKDEMEVIIDLDQIEQRILSLPIDAGSYSDLQCDKDGALFYLERDKQNGRKQNLIKFDLDEKESDSFIKGIAGYEIAQKGKKLIYTKSRGNYSIVKTSGKPKGGDGTLNLSGMKVFVDPVKEWNQIYNEAWRMHRDYFYDEKMHGADWPAVKAKYLPFLKHVGHRTDLSYLLSEMVGELVVGHAYVFGGDYPDVESVGVGLLGADYDIHKNRYRFKKIYSGLNWNPDLRAPLTEPGVDIAEGDYLLAVNGKEITASENLHRYFETTTNQQVILTVNNKPTLKDSRQVTVKTIRGDIGLRYRDWVESNRAYVDKKTNGRVAYLHMPNTAWAGYVSFNRYYFAQKDRDALILDERWNGGGSAADYIIDMLSRPLLNWWVTREGQPWATPWASIYGPKVMIINEAAGSGGDAMPYYFRKRGLGKLVGKRTWGGLVGISSTPQLMDGGAVTIPAFAILSSDNKWVVENEGVAPDIEVDMTPALVIDGKDPQLDAAINQIMKELEDHKPARADVPPAPVRAKKR